MANYGFVSGGECRVETKRGEVQYNSHWQSDQGGEYFACRKTFVKLDRNY